MWRLIFLPAMVLVLLGMYTVLEDFWYYWRKCDIGIALDVIAFLTGLMFIVTYSRDIWRYVING